MLATYSAWDPLTFGRHDIVLASDFDGRSSLFKCSHGISFGAGSTEVQTLLAREPTFRADIVEVRGFFTVEGL